MTRTRTAANGKYIESYVEDEDLVVEDASDLDEDWDLNQCEKRLLQEEDEDDEDFFFLQLQTM